MTIVLLIATAGLLGTLAVSCMRAQREVTEPGCDCRRHRRPEPLPADVVPFRPRRPRPVDPAPSGLRPAG